VRFKIEHPWKFELVTAAFGLLALAWLYLHSLSPAFPPNDSPETIAAALTLGIQHPPGYPLATLLGRLSIVALGLGSAAWRMNCLSAALGVLSALLAGALAWRLSEGSSRSTRFGAALAAGAWLGVGATLWEQATEAKGGLYLLNLALGFGLWHACLSAVRGSRAGLRALALLAGLMLAAHHLSAAPWLLVALCWLAWAARDGRVPAPLSALWLLLPGLALYAYLPVRAAQDPLLDFGHPADWTQFKWMLTRAGYAAGPPLSAALIREQLAVLGRGVWQGSWMGLLLVPVALGVGALWRGRREAALALGAAAALSLLAGAVLNSTPADNRWLVLIFCLPGLALLPVAAGVGWGRLAERLRWGRYLLAVGLLLIAALAWRQWPRLDRRGSYAAWDYAQDMALSLPQGALYVGEGDYHVLPLIYRQAEGKRRDLSLILATLAG
jgi:hypothetical protein